MQPAVGLFAHCTTSCVGVRTDTSVDPSLYQHLCLVLCPTLFNTGMYACLKHSILLQ
jgi:hypothetical protein